MPPNPRRRNCRDDPTPENCNRKKGIFVTLSIPQLDDFPDPGPQAASQLPAASGFSWSRENKLREVLNIAQPVTDRPGMDIAPDSRGLILTLRGVTLGHVRWNGRIDLPFGPEVWKQLVAEPRADCDPDRSREHEAVFHVRHIGDIDRALWLLRLAYLIVDSKVDGRATDVVGLSCDAAAFHGPPFCGDYFDNFCLE